MGSMAWSCLKRLRNATTAELMKHVHNHGAMLQIAHTLSKRASRPPLAATADEVELDFQFLFQIHTCSEMREYAMLMRRRPERITL